MYKRQPLVRRHHRPGLGAGVGEGDPLGLALGRELDEPFAAGLPLEFPEALGGEASVGGAGQGEDGLAHLRGGGEGRPSRRHSVAYRAAVAAQFVDLAVRVDGDALRGGAEGVEERADGADLLGDGGVVALDDDELGHGPAGDRLTLPRLPVPYDAAGLGEFVGGVVQKGHGEYVGAGAEVIGCQRAELVRDRQERVVVGAGLPGRGDGRSEGVHEGVHVRAGQVVLLVPGRGRQDDVGEQAGGRHPEVHGDQQVELALGRLLPPDHVLRAGLGRRLLTAYGAVGAEEMAQEVLVALAGGAEQVGPPHRQDAREVGGVVGVLGSEPQSPGLDLVHDVLGHRASLRGRLVRQVQRVAVEAGVARRPAEPDGLGEAVGEPLAREPALAQWRGQLVGSEGLVPPLVGVEVPVGGARHVPGGALPVEGERQVLEPGDRADLLLADVVRPAAAVDALAAGHGRQRQEGAVDRVGVEPVVGARAHGDHRTALGALGVTGELTGDAGRLLGGHGGDRLLPRRGVGLGGVLVRRRPAARQAGAVDSVLGEHQVEDGGDEPAADPADRHTPDHRRAALGDALVEAGQGDLDAVLGAVEEAELRDDVAQVEIPAASPGLSPPETERAAGDHRFTGGPVQKDGLESCVLFGLLFAAEVGGGQEPVRYETVIVLAQRHQERRVRERPQVVLEIRHFAFDEELAQDHVPHGHRQRPVRARVRGEPLVGVLDVVGVVGADGDDLGAVVAGLGEEVRVGRAGDGDVGAPHHQVSRVPPVRRLRYVGLVAEDLR